MNFFHEPQEDLLDVVDITELDPPESFPVALPVYNDQNWYSPTPFQPFNAPFDEQSCSASSNSYTTNYALFSQYPSSTCSLAISESFPDLPPLLDAFTSPDPRLLRDPAIVAVGCILLPKISIKAEPLEHGDARQEYPTHLASNFSKSTWTLYSHLGRSTVSMALNARTAMDLEGHSIPFPKHSTFNREDILRLDALDLGNFGPPAGLESSETDVNDVDELVQANKISGRAPLIPAIIVTPSESYNSEMKAYPANRSSLFNNKSFDPAVWGFVLDVILANDLELKMIAHGIDEVLNGLGEASDLASEVSRVLELEQENSSVSTLQLDDRDYFIDSQLQQSKMSFTTDNGADHLLMSQITILEHAQAPQRRTIHEVRRAVTSAQAKNKDDQYRQRLQKKARKRQIQIAMKKSALATKPAPKEQNPGPPASEMQMRCSCASQQNEDLGAEETISSSQAPDACVISGEDSDDKIVSIIWYS